MGVSLITDGSELRSLRYPPGESPFHVKGIAYRGHLEYVEAHVPGGVDAMKAAFPDPAVAAFFDQVFLASNFYDVMPLAHAGVICADLTGLPFHEFVRRRTIAQAEADIRGVYKWLLSILSPRMIGSRLPKVLAQYLDYLTFEPIESSPKRVVGRLKGIPIELGCWQSAVFEAYYTHVFQLGGLTDFALSYEDLRSERAPDGITRLDVGLVLEFA
ncbi:MAG: hypothetical protein GXY23_10635 [Myxococcales bacterium]|nr:hypothetical protein [Myxococcales bacterium]